MRVCFGFSNNRQMFCVHEMPESMIMRVFNQLLNQQILSCSKGFQVCFASILFGAMFMIWWCCWQTFGVNWQNANKRYNNQMTGFQEKRLNVKVPLPLWIRTHYENLLSFSIYIQFSIMLTMTYRFSAHVYQLNMIIAICSPSRAQQIPTILLCYFWF